MADEDEKTQSQTGGLPIAIGPLKLRLEIENIERLRATWQKYCVPISKQFWPLLRNEIDIGLQKQLLRKLKNVADLDEKAREILTARHAAAEEISPSISGPLLEAAAEEERDELKEVWAKLLAAAMVLAGPFRGTRGIRAHERPLGQYLPAVNGRRCE